MLDGTQETIKFHASLCNLTTFHLSRLFKNHYSNRNRHYQMMTIDLKGGDKHEEEVTCNEFLFSHFFCGQMVCRGELLT